MEGDPDEHGIVALTCGCLHFMFYFPHSPTLFYGVIHRAYGFQPQYSVLTHLYRMEYMDDPDGILGSCAHINRQEGCWILDNDQLAFDSIPLLVVLPITVVKSHLLMIPYHEYSKFMIGVVDQSLWSDSFVTY